MRKISLLLTFLLFLLSKTESQAQIAFSQEYGGAYNEDGRWMEQMPDSGFIMTGGTTTYSNGQTDIWLVRTDAYGNVVWTKSIGGTSFDFANMVKPLSDGFIICGVTNRNGSDDAILVRTDLSGNTLWTKVIGDNGIQWFEGVYPTSDGGFTCVGVNTSGTHGTYDIYLVKFDATGTIVWERNIGGQSYEIGNSVQQTPDGGYIIGGQTYSWGALDGDFYLVKTDAQGIVEWDSTYARTHLQECHYAQVTPDGGYIMVGDADTLPNGFGDTDIWLIKTNSTGHIVWEQVLGGSKKDGGKTVENTSDGGFVIAGITRSFGLINPNYYLVKTSSTGAMEWQVSSYGTTHHDHAYRGIETSDGGFAEFGFFRNASSFMNFALVKLGPNGGVTKDIAVDEIISPDVNVCRSNGVDLGVLITNYGQTNEQNIDVTMEISNGVTTTLVTDSFIGSLTPGASTTLNFSGTYDFNVDGSYTLKAYTHHRNSDISYNNDTALRTVTVIPPTSDPVTTSAISCNSGSLTLTSSPAASTDSMFWFDAAVNGNLLETGNTYVTPSLNTTTTYYVQSIKGKGSKVGMANNLVGSGSASNDNYLKFDSRTHFKLVSVLVYPTSSGNRTIQLRDASNAVLQSKTVNLPSAPGGIRVYLNFDVPEANDLQLYLTSGSSNLFRNSSGAVFPYSVSQTVEIYGASSSNPATYYYFYDWYIFVPSENCESNRVPVQGIIGSNNTTAFDVARCGNGPVTLSANSSGSLSWYANSSGGSSLGTGSTFTTPSLSSTTTYYLQAGSCPNRIAVDAIINTQSSQPSASDVTRCGPGTVNLTATASDPISWYSAPVNGVLVHSGSSFTTPFLNTTTTYYAVASNGCPSAPKAVQAIVNGAASPVVTGASACGPASVVLSASSPDPVAWYTVPSGGSPIATTPTYTTPVISSPVTYYVEAGTSCPSPRVPVVANVNTTAPPVGTNAGRCGPGTVVLSAQSTNTVTWWTQATGGSQVGSGLIFTTPSISATTTYYAQASAPGCNSQRTPVVASINVTAPPSVSPGAHCGPGTVTLSASSPDSIFWYSASTGGSPLANGPTFTTPSLNTTTTYYAQAGGVCPSTRVSVLATISTGAANPTTTDSARCGNGTVTLTASSPEPITWYDAPGGNIVGTGASFVTPSLSATTTFYAVAGVAGCVSSPVAAVATVNPMPAAPGVTGAQNCGPAQLTLTATSSNAIEWWSAATGGTLLTTGTSYTANFNTTTTVYVSAKDGTCTSNRVPVVATINSVPSVNIGPATIVLNSGQSATLNAGPGPAGTTYLWSTGATTQTISVNSANVYWVTVTNASNCTGSDTITVTIINGISSLENENAVVIYPNPSNGTFSISVKELSVRYDVRITDAAGKLVYKNENNRGGQVKEYFLSNAAAGVYFIQIIAEDGILTRPLIIK